MPEGSRGQAELTFWLVLADVAVLGHAQVCVTLACRAHPDTVVSVGGMGLSWQPVLTALQIKSFASLLGSSACKIIEADPDIEAPSESKEGGRFQEIISIRETWDRCNLWFSIEIITASSR